MLACVDVDYRPDVTVAACVLFRGWTDGKEAGHLVERGPIAEPYEPGQFYRRELPHLLRVLAGVQEPLEAIIVDGYVWLGEDKPGLGAHLYEALCQAVPVIGVAKTPYVTTGSALPIVRGQSLKPLLITAIGMETATAAEHIRRMHGSSRMPTMLKFVDRLCRES
ncbi:endonuclease V [Corallococcus exercitus]|uniref:Endonuclease V n=1 Tax=Corallococcus exercitus TaxID=2316736 RepID=A0A3A8HQT1_9BACT|nr:endonuclease V [Corallococcus exercitus]NOK31922.1 endonuclease V [Corallococcus exercitus]RKG73629.1 endonuclease V [Corallococcus exercitus]